MKRHAMYIIKQSSIEGQGVYAQTDIKKGDYILEYKGEKISKREGERRSNARTHHVFIFDLNKKYDIDGDVPENDAKYINHSCDPNCEAVICGDEIWIIALKDIRKGDELTYDYNFELDDNPTPCHCMSKKCRGYIIREEDLHSAPLKNSQA